MVSPYSIPALGPHSHTYYAGYAYFAPSIVRSFGYGPIETQLRSVPPWVVAFALAMTIATFSDYFKHRFAFTIIPLLIGLTGAIILITVHDNIEVQYAALFLFAGGCYSAMPVVVCWFNTNLAGHHRRSVGTAWQVGFGNIGGIIATYSFLQQDAPRYTRGYIITICFISFSILSCTAYFLAVTWENRRRDKGTSSVCAGNKGSNATGDSAEDKRTLGDLWEGYRYMR